MNSKDAYDQIVKPKLIEVFGSFMGSAIASNAYMQAIKKMTHDKTIKDTYLIVIESICCNKEVVAMWGIDGANKQKEEWLSIIN